MTVVFASALLLALSILLPLWWHRRQQQNTDNTFFAAARFLPNTPATQRRIWRWQQRLLLLLRIAILLALTALLSDWSFPFRQKTDLASLSRWQSDPTLQDATVFCSTKAKGCDIIADDIWLWLAQHEREWRTDLSLTIHAYADEIAMPALRPHYAHPLNIDIARREQTLSPLQLFLVGDLADPPLNKMNTVLNQFNIQLLNDRKQHADVALYSDANIAEQEWAAADLHVVFSATLDADTRFELNQHQWSYRARGDARVYQTKRPVTPSQWRDFFSDLQQLKSSPRFTAASTANVAAQPPSPRLWPSNALRDYLLLLLMLLIFSERVLHHVIHRSR